MKITIEATPKEIAAFVLELQERQGGAPGIMSSQESSEKMHILTADELPGPLVGIGQYYEPSSR